MTHEIVDGIDPMNQIPPLIQNSVPTTIPAEQTIQPIITVSNNTEPISARNTNGAINNISPPNEVPKPNTTPLPTYLQNIPLVADKAVITPTKQPDHKSHSLLEQLIYIQQQNQSILKDIVASAALSAKIAKKKYRWEVAKFWLLIVKYTVLAGIMIYSFLVSYQLITQFMDTILPSLSKINQSVSAVENMNGSMKNFDLGSLLQKMPNNSSENSIDTVKENPSLMESLKKIDLSNMDSEALLQKLNITPYKSVPIEKNE